jgi:hypothetical protein
MATPIFEEPHCRISDAHWMSRDFGRHRRPWDLSAIDAIMIEGELHGRVDISRFDALMAALGTWRAA